MIVTVAVGDVRAVTVFEFDFETRRNKMFRRRARLW
jgi:hypothetical protein